MRNKLQKELKEAMKSKDQLRLSTLRLILAAIKDRDIALRVREDAQGVDDKEIVVILSKMVKQRQESCRVYEESGRLDLAQRELDEIGVIQDFLPRQLSNDEVEAAISKAIQSTGASTVRDMGKVMSILKDDFSGQIDFGKVGGMVKDALAR